MATAEQNNNISHEIGDRLRKLRGEQKMSLRDLSREVGVSASALSQIENGVVNPSVATLLRLADCLSIPVSFFFEDLETETPAVSSESQCVVRASNRHRIRLENGITWESLLPHEETNREWFVLHYEPGAGSEQTMVQHNGREYGLVVEGFLVVQLGFGEYELGPGDSIAFDGTTPHALKNNGRATARGVWTIEGRNEPA